MDMEGYILKIQYWGVNKLLKDSLGVKTLSCPIIICVDSPHSSIASGYGQKTPISSQKKGEFGL